MSVPSISNRINFIRLDYRQPPESVNQAVRSSGTAAFRKTTPYFSRLILKKGHGPSFAGDLFCCERNVAQVMHCFASEIVE
jgi:hypothetical protein